jgi:penicillin-binding protein 1A
MEKYDFLSEAAYDSITKQPIVLKLNRSTHLSGLAPYLREFLRLNLTAKEPIRENYHSAQSWLEDSTEWATNPLYGWCNKNRKSNNDFYNLYQDGLRVYTTIDSRMQTYAEEAMEEHMPEIQTLFSKQKGQDKGWGERGPYSSKLSKDDVERILHQSMLRSERYRSMYVAGASKEEIEKSFNEPTDMTVFSWHGERDTVMTPMDSIRYYKYYLSSGFMSVEPATGYVRAYVGGLNYKYFKYDHVTVAKRQVGSTFKPFIYTLAMQAGYSPCHEVPNIDYTFEMPEGQSPRTYTPQFSTNQYISYTNGRMVSLKFGLANSMNQISAWVLKQYSPDAAIAIARAMGVRSRLDPVPSLCTGAAEASLYEMVGAYTSFVNKGIYSRPVFVSRIEDKHGNVLASFKSKQSIAISEETAFKMVSMMQGVVDYGTSQRLRYKYKFTNPIAGKTGTTNDNSDGWFIGMIPNLVSGAWVGGEERSIRFGNTLYGQGASMALPIWALYMTKVYADPHLKYSKEAFPVPNGFDVSALDCKQYKNDQENNKDNYSQGNEEY